MRRISLLLVAFALLLAGCGGGGGGTTSATPLTKAEYQAKLAQIAKDVSTNVGTVSSGNNLSKADADKIVKLLHSFAAELSKVNPPAELKDLHPQLVTAMNDLADEFPGIVTKLKNTKDPSAAIAALFGAKGIQELTKLEAEFKAKGYNLNLNG